MAAPRIENFELTAALADLANWLIQQGLENTPVEDWLEECCNRLLAAGIQIQRVNMTTRAHHPVIGTLAFRWFRDQQSERFEYERQGAVADEFLQSPIYYLVSNDILEMRRRLDQPNPDPDMKFPIFEDLRAVGTTEYYATKRYFTRKNQTRPIVDGKAEEGMVLSLTTDQPGGFTEAQLEGVRSLIPPICLTLKCGANRAMAEDITAAYLGADASKRVLSGELSRGSCEVLSAVIWYFDLQGFTKLSETLAGTQIIDLLNDYFAEAVDVVEKHGGEVLKFMGDGMLAIFDLTKIPQARAAAIEAAVELRQIIDALNTKRAADNLPTTGFTLGLHAGDVLYGNIGGRTRLDFTVIGPAVNTTARILGMCSAVDQTTVISAAVAAPLRDARPDLVPLGQYRLRGVKERQELFTLD